VKSVACQQLKRQYLLAVRQQAPDARVVVVLAEQRHLDLRERVTYLEGVGAEAARPTNLILHRQVERVTAVLRITLA
jgi:hypothetical protein